MLADLIASRGVVEEHVVGGPTGVMALHGGLEAGTAEVARLTAAQAGASLYAVVQPDDLAWHIPSAEYDPSQSPALSEFLATVGLVVSYHGFGRQGLEGVVLVGGSNRRLADTIGSALARRAGIEAITDLDRIPAGLRGLSPRNPVNLPEFGGVQLELSPQVRNGEHRKAIATVVADALAAEHRSLCAL